MSTVVCSSHCAHLGRGSDLRPKEMTTTEEVYGGTMRPAEIVMMTDFAGESGVLGCPSSVRRDACVPTVFEQLRTSERGTYSNNQDGAYQV